MVIDLSCSLAKHPFHFVDRARPSLTEVNKTNRKVMKHSYYEIPSRLGFFGSVPSFFKFISLS